MIKHRLKLFIVFILTGCLAVQLHAEPYSVKQYGAAGDGKTLDTAAINKTIEAAHAGGGGTVYFPTGTYLSFSIRLKSNIALFLDHGATILAAADGELGGYDEAEPNPWGDKHKYQDFGHSHWHDSLIWGENLENISILGPGMIYGKGLGKWDKPNDKGAGNKAVALKLCRNVVIKDVTFLMGGHFCILPTGVDNFTIDNVKIDTNRDGINVDCCRNVRISNCTINSPNDDAIVLKSSYALGYARATENVTITNCQVTG
ncbi:MAG: glycosyl hydrolase family 28-related protein, partial [Phycisphaerales bacterium]